MSRVSDVAAAPDVVATMLGASSSTPTHSVYPNASGTCDQVNVTGDALVAPPSGAPSAGGVAGQFEPAATVNPRRTDSVGGHPSNSASTYQCSAPAGTGASAVVSATVEATMIGNASPIETQTR